MANDPIVIDDGGSTRIKKILAGGPGAMDSLLDVNPNVPAAGSAGSTHTVPAAGSSYGNLLITSIGPTGAPGAPIATAFSTFEIHSGPHQVNGTLVLNGATGLMDLVLTVFGPSTNEPLVEAKQNNKLSNHKRRYVVANAKAIDSVFVNGTQVFTAAANTLYTSVFVN